MFVTCHFALYSSAGIALSVFAFIFIFSVNKLRKLSVSKKQLFWIGIFLIAMLITSILVVLSDTTNTNELTLFISKISFNENPNEYTSSGARLDQWTRAFNNFIIHPFLGNGPGYGVNENAEGYLSVYLSILSDVGIFAFAFFVLFQVIMIKKIWIIKKPIRNFLYFSFITSILHLIIIADFYHAPFWILLVFIQLVYTESKQKKHEK